MNDETTTEAQIAAVSIAPRVTPADIDAAIASEHYLNAGEVQSPIYVAGTPTYNNALNLLTFCVLVLRNGFTVTGQSACASPENFDAEIGRRIARADAIRQVWPLLGYVLKERLYRASTMGPTYYVRHPDESYSVADPQPVKV